MNNTARNRALAAFISLISLYIAVWQVYGVLKDPLQPDSYRIGDWLINYSSGFVRRGLFGHIALGMWSVTQINIAFIVVAVQCVLVLVWSKVIYDILKDKLDQATIGIVLSPAFVIFPLSDLVGGFRKELLHFVIFGFLCRRFAEGRRFTRWFLCATALAFGFAVFSHEAISFLCLYYVFLLYLANRKNLLSSADFVIAAGFISALAAISLFLAAANPGNERVAQQICESLMNTGLQSRTCDGAIWWLSRDSSYGVSLVKANITKYHYLETYSLAFALSTIPFLMFELLVGRVQPDQHDGDDPRCLRRSAYMLFVASVLLSIPLFVVAVDWGRWIYFQFASFSMLFMAIYSGHGFHRAPDAESAVIRNRSVRTGLVVCLCCASMLWGIPTSRRGDDTVLNEGVVGILRIRVQSALEGIRE